MLVPKLFRWLFFRKKLVENTFDALRNDQSLLVNVDVNLGRAQSNIENSIKLTDNNWSDFVQRENKTHPIILYGNSKNKLNETQRRLEQAGFEKVFVLGTEEELINAKDNLK